LKSLLTSILFYFDLFFRKQGGLLMGIVLLYLMSRIRPLRLTEFLKQWGLLLPALAAFCLYGLVYVEGRYIGVFLVLLWADLLVNIRLPASQTNKRLSSLVSLIMIVFIVMNIFFFNLEGFKNLISGQRTKTAKSIQPPAPSWPGQVAEELYDLGIQPGDKVAVIGYAFDSFWARLARVQIISEMLGSDAEPLWVGGPSKRSEVLEAFRSTEAKAIVAEYVPNYAQLGDDWYQIGNTNYYIYLL
jgi:hypothetical protein